MKLLPKRTVRPGLVTKSWAAVFVRRYTTASVEVAILRGDWWDHVRVHGAGCHETEIYVSIPRELAAVSMDIRVRAYEEMCRHCRTYLLVSLVQP